MALAERVTACGQRHGLFIIHGHPGKSLANVLGGGQRIGIAIRAFGVDVDQAHLNSGQWVFEHTLATIAAAGLVAGGEPLFFGAPIDVFLRLEDVFPATAESERLAAHGFDGAIAGEDHQVGPGNLVAVFLLDRPQQAAGLVEVGIVRPAVQRRKTLRPGGRTAPAVTCPVGAGAVPGHANEERPVMAIVSRPPILGIGHQGKQVLLDLLQIELVEFLGIFEGLTQRVTDGRILVKNAEVELVRPPVAIHAPSQRTHYRALALWGCVISVHIHLPG